MVMIYPRRIEILKDEKEGFIDSIVVVHFTPSQDHFTSQR